MLTRHPYGFGKTVQMSPEEAESRVTEALKNKGFGVLTRIDVAATLKQKLGKEMPPYVILGACNPNLASQALEMEHEIGLLLPCNVVVYQDAQGQVHVSAIDPQPALGLVGNPRIEPIASQARQLIQEALEAV